MKNWHLPTSKQEIDPSDQQDLSPAQGLETGLRQQNSIQFLVYWFSALLAIFHIILNFTTYFSTLWQCTIHFVGLGILGFLIYPLKRSQRFARSPALLIFDILLIISLVIATFWVISAETAIYDRGVSMTGWEQTFALLIILFSIELTRRTTGWIIPLLIIIALSYVVWWGKLLDGVFNFAGLHTETVIFRSIFGDDALFGSIAQISVTYIFMFILFGAFLLRSGAGNFVIMLSRLLAGRMIGGPGIVAVIASGLTGTISGSSIANTVSTGVITIPLMKRAGFPPHFAAGVEAAASTGGQLMPPMMGAGAFIMASYTQIPYTDIILVALLPAILYFLSVAFFVRIEAKRLNFKIEDNDNLPSFKTIMQQGGIVFVVPVTILVSLLVIGFTPTYAASIAIVSVICSSWLTPNKMGIHAIVDALALGSKNMVTTGLLLVAIGLVVNVIAMTGIGNTLSLMIQEWAGGNLLIALTLVAGASLILGMGLPVTAAYIVLATLSAPALYQLMAEIELVNLIASGIAFPESAKAMIMLATPDSLSLLGQAMSIEQAREILASLRLVDPSIVTGMYEQLLSPTIIISSLLSAHMIIFWLSQDSNVTPPVCLTAFAAAAIAGSCEMKTGFTAWKLAKGIYIMPLLFAYTPFLHGDFFIAFQIFLFSMFGLYAFAAAFQGYLESRLTIIERLFLAALAICLIYPSIEFNLIALIIFLSFFIFDKKIRSQKLTKNK